MVGVESCYARISVDSDTLSSAIRAPSRDVTDNYILMNSLDLIRNWAITSAMS